MIRTSIGIEMKKKSMLYSDPWHAEVVGSHEAAKTQSYDTQFSSFPM
jgi:hypothetical protein